MQRALKRLSGILGWDDVSAIVLSLASLLLILETVAMFRPGSRLVPSGLSISLLTSLLIYMLVDQSFRAAERRREVRERSRFQIFYGDESKPVILGALVSLQDTFLGELSNALADKRYKRIQSVISRARGAVFQMQQTTILQTSQFIAALRDEDLTDSIERYLRSYQRLSSIKTTGDFANWLHQTTSSFSTLALSLDPDASDAGWSESEVNGLVESLNSFGARSKPQ